MSETLLVADKHVVYMHYTLKNPEGEVIDSSSGRDPLAYLHGSGNIVPGLERQLTGLAIGATKTAIVPPTEGYGERQPMPPEPVPRSQFPADANIAEGMMFQAQTPDGRPFPVWVAKVEDDTVYIDPNHPLAGVELHFEVEIVEVRSASEEEISHGHPHGPGGHHH